MRTTNRHAQHPSRSPRVPVFYSLATQGLDIDSVVEGVAKSAPGNDSGLLVVVDLPFAHLTGGSCAEITSDLLDPTFLT